ncbi:MAG TPA: hypothetical protein GXX30_07600 [Firmicutes bacterium]|nr:hypothetical protein [Candidatus Fermentithermobacillaceae bacterium]
MTGKVTTNDIVAKVAAVILALIVWVQVFNDKNPLEKRILSLDVEPKNYGDKLVVGLNPQKVNVTIEGRAKTLAEVEKEKPKAIADLTGVEPGESAVSLTVSLPRGVKLLEINPKKVTVTLDVSHTRKVPVIVEVQGDPNEDYTKGIPYSIPQQVEVKGPRTLVDKVQSAVGVVDVTGAVKEVTGVISVVPKDAMGNEVKGVDVDPKEVKVTVPMTALPPAKTVRVHVPVVGTPKSGFKVVGVAVEPEVVKLRADPSIIGSINSLSTKSVDVSGKDASFETVAVLDVPRGVSVQTYQVRVRVEIAEDIIERTFKDVIVQLLNPAPGLAWQLDPPVVDIVLTGRSDILSRIKAAEIEAYIDADGRPEGGPYELIVVPKVPDSENIRIDVRPARVKLTLTKR